ncbi:MAG: hypothetical protein WCO94_05340 [Verrucomicrobiota bacterium]
MKTIFALLSALGLFFAVPLVEAQAQDPALKTVKVRFRTFGWDSASSDLNYSQKNKDAKIEVFQDNRSVFYDYEGPAAISFYRIKAKPDGQIEHVVVARANLDGAGAWPLLIFAKNSPKSDDYTVLVLPDDLQGFPAGSFKFANFTNKTMTGSLGPESFRLEPRDIKLLTVRPSSNSTTLFAIVNIESGRKTIPVYTNNWAYQPMLRTLVFIMQSPETPSGVVARRIVESTEFPPEKPASGSPAAGGR